MPGRSPRRTATLRSLQRLRAVPWSDLWRDWEKREGVRREWIAHARSRGFRTWREWRAASYDRLQPAARRWTLYRVDDPARLVPTWFGGPFRGWRKYSGGSMVTFRTIAKRSAVRRNGKVLALERRFPTATQVIGLLWRGRIVIIEGMHRCTAIALAAARHKTLAGRLTIALTPLAGRLPDLSSRLNRHRR